MFTKRIFIVITFIVSFLGYTLNSEAQNKKNETTVIVQIATDGAYPPFSYSNLKGEIKGFDVDLGNAICKMMRYTCVWNVYDTSNLIDAIQSGTIQVAIVSKSISQKLLNNIVVSGAYYSPNYVLVYHRDKSPKGTRNSDLLNTTIGALKDTTEFDIIKNTYSGSRVKAMPQLETAFYALSRKEIDYLIIDFNVVEPWLAAKGDGRCCVYRNFSDDFLGSEQAKIMINKDVSPIQAGFINGLKQLQEKGSLRKIASDNGLDERRFTQNSISPYQ